MVSTMGVDDNRTIGSFYSHARVTGSVEREIGLIQNLIRVAVTPILRNPNFPALDFTPPMIFKLWREFALWAVIIINLKPCPRIPENHVMKCTMARSQICRIFVYYLLDVL